MKFLGRYNFNKEGMSKDELSFFANFKSIFPKNTVIEAEYYGHGKWLRKSGLYPQKLPILLRTTHGPDTWDSVANHYFECGEKYVGFYTKRLCDDFKRRQNKVGSFVLKAPAYYCFKKKYSNKKQVKQGSIFFVSHSTFKTKVDTDHSNLICFLENLPDRFKPISLCFHFNDVLDGKTEVYFDKGYKIYCAGNFENKYFIENFFEIVNNFKYAIGNEMGSQFLYCTLAGIKSIIFPEVKTTILIENDSNHIAAKKDGLTFLRSQELLGIFSDTNDYITENQKLAVEVELGIKDGTSPIFLSFYLYWSLISYRIDSFRSLISRYIKRVFFKDSGSLYF